MLHFTHFSRRIPPLLDRIGMWCRQLIAHPGLSALAVFIYITAERLSFLRADPDLFARVAVGRLVLSGPFPYKDPFSYSPKKEWWYDHEWLSGVVFYVVSQLGGGPGLLLLKLAACLLTIFLISYAQRHYFRRSAYCSIWLLLSIFMCGYVWDYTVRSQIFTYLFLPAYLLCFVAYEKYRTRSVLFFLPLAMIVWANLHGGFAVGVGLTLLFGFGYAVQSRGSDLRPLLASVLTAAATLINPYGYHYLDFIFTALTMPRPNITEWQPVGVWNDAFGMALFIYAAILIYGWWRSPALRRIVPFLLLTATYAYAWRHARLLAAFMMVAAVYGTPHFAALMQDIVRLFGRLRQPLLNTIALTVSMLVILRVPHYLHFVPQLPRLTLNYENYQVQAVEWLWHTQTGGNVLVEYAHGSYALWRLFPRFLVSLDGRYEEVYPQRTVDLVRAVFRETGTKRRDALNEVMADYLILRTPSEQAALMAAQDLGPGWRVVYFDGVDAVLQHRPEIEQMEPASQPPALSPVWEPRF